MKTILSLLSLVISKEGHSTAVVDRAIVLND